MIFSFSCRLLYFSDKLFISIVLFIFKFILRYPTLVLFAKILPNIININNKDNINR
ncbi:hypothetical protein BPP43_11345 [Brachyspira pilosicoli P43/6/78]|uniref:Uncharacterized protein n=1 Tax=Brachyspira pilosicoli P43/6/78 TaxID=1042417 RepID=A0A3B6VNL1_BRAPL|nr:hypothetical protein BPP43_11345 [Brachyspira pilosicoli P43/6/78]